MSASLNHQQSHLCASSILVVEDDDKHRLLLTTVLQKQGYCILEAKNGSEAVEIFNCHQPDLILMDAIMPIMDGFEATQQIRQDEIGQQVVILMITALSDDESANRAFKTGATDFIVKPVDVSVLLHRIAHLLKAKHSQHQNEWLIEHLHDRFIFRHLPNRSFAYVSSSIKHMLGYTSEEFRKNYADLFTDDPQNLAIVDFPTLSNRSQTPINLTVEIKSLSGRLHWLEITMVPHRNHRGQVIALEGMAIDITEKMVNQRQTFRDKAVFQKIINAVNEPMMVIRPDYQIIRMNDAARSRMLQNHHFNNPESPHCYEVSHHHSHPCDSKDHPCPLHRVLEKRQPVTVLHNHPDPDGKARYFEISASPLFTDGGEIEAIVEISRDITNYLAIMEELRDQERNYHHLATHDPLTGLANRRLFEEQSVDIISKAKRDSREFALLYIDLDQFKKINDSLGHLIGDKVIIDVAKRFENHIRSRDLIARLSGDEFIVVMESGGEHEKIATLARHLIDTLKDPILVDGHELYIGASIGISLFPHDGDTLNELLKNADAAMYTAKDSGRNTCSFYTPKMTEKAFEHILLESSLRHALMNQEFVIHYQPQVLLANQKLIGLEALLRWQHPDLGLIPPGKFIPIAEETGLIISIGEWVMRQVTQQISTWYRSGLNPGKVAINIAGPQLEHGDLCELLTEILDETGCRPEWIELEVTESFIMKHPKKSIALLKRIQEKGIEISIDDFGTGYSSLSYLKQLPINTLKIDLSFVRDILTNPDDRAITQAIIALAASLNLETIAEGIENREQGEMLAEKGCRVGQGFFYGRPMPAEDIVNFIGS